ncbi:MAG: helix-turn-helix domain-containing protein [Chloroflexota bacterium]|nr:helix-turn-helix domain-containing protein [Chloroflexota bacterium]
MIGSTIKQLRLERNKSQEALALEAHVSSGYLSKLERELYKAPSQEVLGRIAAALKIPIAELYRAAGIEHLLVTPDPALEPLLVAFASKLDNLPKRDRDIVVGELRRIFNEENKAEAEQGGPGMAAVR